MSLIDSLLDEAKIKVNTYTKNGRTFEFTKQNGFITSVHIYAVGVQGSSQVVFPHNPNAKEEDKKPIPSEARYSFADRAQLVALERVLKVA